MTNETELMPCPFCGGEAGYFEYYNSDHIADKFRVSCNSCGAMKDAFKSTPENAASSWNTRADLHNDGVCRDHFPASPDSARCLEELTTLQGQTFWNTNEALHAWAEWSNKNAVVIRDALQSRADHFVDVNKMVPTEDAQRALDQMHLIVFDGCDDADKVMETIRAALLRMKGE